MPAVAGAVGVAGPLVSISEGRCAVGGGSVADAGCSLTTAPLSWRGQGVVVGAVGGGAERCARLVVDVVGVDPLAAVADEEHYGRAAAVGAAELGGSSITAPFYTPRLGERWVCAPRAAL